MTNVPAWVLLGLLSALFASLVAIFGRLGLQAVDPTAATAARSVVMMAVLVGATLVSGRLSALQGADALAWTMILLSGLAGAASWLCYFLALQLGQAAPVASLDRLSLVFTVFLAALVLGEPLNLPRVAGAARRELGVGAVRCPRTRGAGGWLLLGPGPVGARRPRYCILSSVVHRIPARAATKRFSSSVSTPDREPSRPVHGDFPGPTLLPRETSVISMAYADKTLVCRDCGNEFTFTAGEQEFFAQKGFVNEPGRCNECRAARKSQRGGTSYDSDRGYNGGYGSYSRAPREMFEAVCSECGGVARVPFQPRSDKPVYCSSCFEQKRSYR